MSLLQKFIGRRQFLIATGVASTCALTCKKLSGFETRAAMAAEKASTAALKSAGNRCPHLLSPLRIRNRVLKNRIVHTQSANYTMQGPENYPTETLRNHYLNMAKNAAIVTMTTMFGTYPKKYTTKADGLEDWLYEAVNSWEHIGNDKWEDIPPVWNYVERMIDDIHTEGSLILCSTKPNTTVSRGGGGLFVASGEASGQNDIVGMQKASEELMKKQGGSGGGRGGGAPGGGGMPGQPSQSVADIVKDAKECQSLGYDVYQMRSPTLEAVQAVRSATDLIIMAYLNYAVIGNTKEKSYVGIRTPNQPTAEELEKGIEDVRKLEGLADFVFIRAGSEHPNSFVQDQDKPWSIAYTEAVKKAGLKILTCAGAGLHDPVQNDQFIAKGLTDMVGMATPLFCDPELVKKVAAGRADDVLQCYMCQDCHATSMLKGPTAHIAKCDLNPKWGTPAYKLASIQPPLMKKKVAVIGGGPAGMKAAITAAERGHKVTLFEKDEALGGLIKFSDYSKSRWNMKVFKDYLIHQVNKNGVEVKLKTTATPEMIKAAGFDTILVATGAEVIESRMKGSDAANVFNILTCYNNKKALGENVVMIGAGKLGTEAAIGIVKDDHKITVLAPGDEMIDAEDIGPHSVGNQERIYKNHPNFKYFMKTVVKSITGGKVVYTDEKGDENSIQADSIVIWSGLRPRMDEAEKFIGSAAEVLLLGDCTGTCGRIQKTIRSAFFVASQV
jgi:2,4-dienoyl-CoA reductase-like NADH-dependent reductase (Old Yellow Enzyme family)/NADPH-dependent 2,4-dienoyl-CoA reductase/sulfur reductase-like enzyme